MLRSSDVISSTFIGFGIYMTELGIAALPTTHLSQSGATAATPAVPAVPAATSAAIPAVPPIVVMLYIVSVILQNYKINNKLEEKRFANLFIKKMGIMNYQNCAIYTNYQITCTESRA
ncbi:hypothetical protein RIR_jg33901.t1 [Rhizophagus irregularis DAOM 181602=DAOM 197198]|nr:hypothetical protein RIR_jg33901.t1 [Rhizophagus irregularis DAOM 181602=DAOM 197198]